MKHQIEDVLYDHAVEAVVKEFHLDPTRLKRIGEYENVIYECSLNNDDCIIRITHESHRNENLLKGELEWIDYLEDHGVPVAAPICLTNSDKIIPVNVGNAVFFITFFTKANGSHVKAEDWSNELITLLGQEIGKLHHHSRQYIPTDSGIRRPEWNDGLLNPEYDDTSKLGSVIRKRNEVMRQLATMRKTDASYGLIHFDINSGNLKLSNGGITLFDFDDCCYCWFINDIAVLLVESINVFCDTTDKRPFVSNFLEHFSSGYEQFQHIDEYMMILLPLFAKLRELELYASLIELPVSEYSEHEKQFMVNRKDLIDNDVPFAELR